MAGAYIARGGQKSGHKYTKRTGSPGNYHYVYPPGSSPSKRARAHADAVGRSADIAARGRIADAARRRQVAAITRPTVRTATRANVRANVRTPATALRPRSVESAAAKTARLQRAAGFNPAAPPKINVAKGAQLVPRTLRGGALMAFNRKQAALAAAKTAARGGIPPEAPALLPTAAPRRPPVDVGRARRIQGVDVHGKELAFQHQVARRQQQVALADQSLRHREQLHQLRVAGATNREVIRQTVARARVARLTGRAVPARGSLVGGVARGGAKLAGLAVVGAIVGGVVASSRAAAATKVWVGPGTVATVAPDGTVVSTGPHIR